MFKVVFLVARKDGTAADQYQRYSTHVHAPLVKKIPGLRRYVVNYAQAVDGAEPTPYDGLIELWFDDASAFAAAMASKVGRAAVADQAEFLATDRTVMIPVAELVVVD